MFHIHSIERVIHNVPLESLSERAAVARVQKIGSLRKTLPVSNEPSVGISAGVNAGAGGQADSFVEKAYSRPTDLNRERAEILYAHEIMSTPVRTLAPELNIIEAWQRLNHEHVHHMPVVSSKQKIIGIVSENDLLRRLLVARGEVQNDSTEKVQDVMTRQVISADRMTDIRRIAKAMFELHFGTMLVLGDGGELAGIITRSDILYALIHYPPLKLWA